jgi:hypothetical protein
MRFISFGFVVGFSFAGKAQLQIFNSSLSDSNLPYFYIERILPGLCGPVKMNQMRRPCNSAPSKQFNLYFAPMNSPVTVVLFLIFLISACGSKKKTDRLLLNPQKMAANYETIRNLRPLLQSGDMIFRNGNDEVSRAARSFNRKDTSYSHCGLIFSENDSVFVYHALGGTYNPSQKLMRQAIDSFCNPAENNAIAVYRYPLNVKQQNKLQQVVQGYYRAGLRFDLFFNYESDDKMYCAEFVFKSLNRSVDSVLTSYVRMDTVPYGITTDDLFLHPASRLIKTEKFIY